MAGLLEGLGGLAGNAFGGLMDFRQNLINQRNDLLNPLVQRMQQQQAQGAQDFTRQQIGQTGQGLVSEDGFHTDLGPAHGLLADPRFADNKAELVMGANFMGNRATQQLGSSIIDKVVSQQQTIDTTQANQYAELLQKSQQDQRKQFEQNRTTALAIGDDIRRELGPAAQQIAGLEGMYNTLIAGSPADAIASVFQFMNVLEPGGIVREGEQQQIRGIGGAFSQLANTLNQIEGKGFTPGLRRDLAATVTRIMKPRIQERQETAQGFEQQIQQAQLGQAAGVASSQLPNLQLPQMPASLAPVQAAPPPPPPGAVPGRAPENRRRSVREQRGR